MSDYGVCSVCDHHGELRTCQDCREQSCLGCEIWRDDDVDWLCLDCYDKRAADRMNARRHADWDRLTPAQRDARIREATK